MKTYINGSRQLNNIFWAVSITLGGLGFFLTGLSSYLRMNLVFFANIEEITFIPQGIVLLFYGTVGLILGLFLCLTVWWDVGFGYNDYDTRLQRVLVYRKGFPGKNRELLLSFDFEEVKSIKIRVRDGLNPKRQILLCLKDGREIPLMGVEQLLSLKKIESEAVNLAKYLSVYLETLVE